MVEVGKSVKAFLTYGVVFGNSIGGKSLAIAEVYKSPSRPRESLVRHPGPGPAPPAPMDTNGDRLPASRARAARTGPPRAQQQACVRRSGPCAVTAPPRSANPRTHAAPQRTPVDALTTPRPRPHPLDQRPAPVARHAASPQCSPPPTTTALWIIARSACNGRLYALVESRYKSGRSSFRTLRGRGRGHRAHVHGRVARERSRARRRAGAHARAGHDRLRGRSSRSTTGSHSRASLGTGYGDAERVAQGAGEIRGLQLREGS
jgi:hypothetical protein